MSITFSPQQGEAARAIQAWFVDAYRKPFFYLGGFAGAGKSSVAAAIAQDLVGDRVRYAAFTGKAALVMRSKGAHGAQTIHSMIYKPQENIATGETFFVVDRGSDVKDAGLIVIDECSMVNEELGRDLISFRVPVLVLGDPAQLPPVKGDGFFTAGDPDFMLTEIHRQAQDNPIIRLSMLLREGGRAPMGEHGDSRVIEKTDLGQRAVMGADQVLVGLNRTRSIFNWKIRVGAGRNPETPEAGDRLVCLRNNREKGLLNGSLWTVIEVGDQQRDRLEFLVQSLDEPEKVPVPVVVLREIFEVGSTQLPWRERLGFDEFTYGYALTVHKAQGSQWNNVTVFDESGAFQADRARHAYTAITRAAERVTFATGRGPVDDPRPAATPASSRSSRREAAHA